VSVPSAVPSFDFASASRISFGRGRLAELGAFCSGFGRRALLVTGSSAVRSRVAEAALEAAGVDYRVVRVQGEPGILDATAGVDQGRSFGAELVVAFGGGSAVDLGKAIAALLANGGEPLDYLEVIGKNRPLERPALPCIAIPTTAGTGSEVTKNAVLASKEHGVKVSLRHESMLPRVALVDPDLTVSVPASVTAATGLDALTQCIEPYLSCQANPLTDAIALEGVRRGARSLARAFRDGTDTAAREDMALCSLFGGLSLANAKLGAVHGFAGPIGGMFDSPHGAVCARLLPFVLETNLTALRARLPQSPLLARFDTLAQVLTGHVEARAGDGVRWVQTLCDELSVPPLSSYGMTSGHIEDVVQKAMRASSMKGNPLPLEVVELTAILEGAL
jgi:alcohol dehydrogenase class IV